MKATIDPVSVRNLEQIQEEERRLRAPSLSVALLSGLGIGAVAVAAVMTLRPGHAPTAERRDPLADLVREVQQTPAASGAVIDSGRATFASRLVDQERATTPITAVKGEKGELLPQEVGPSEPTPPPALDKLPVVPLPAGTLLQATRVTSDPDDGLTELARIKSEAAPVDPPPIPGTEGGYSIQVASFREQNDADGFVGELQKRGYSSFRQAAYVPNRGLWHRVRIGPFKYKHEALSFQKDFEQKERMSTFLVDPDKVERQRAARAAKLAEQD